MKKKNRRYLIYGVLALIALAIIIALTPWNPIRGRSFEFSGNLIGIEGDTMALEGRFVVEGDDNLPPDTVIVKAFVNSDAVINRTAIELPSEEELDKTGGQFNVDDLNQITTTVTLGDLQADAGISAIGMTVKSERNIFGKSEFKVSEINYRMAR
jgi:hypothetical protein